MEINKIEKNQDLEIDNNINNEREQKNFLETMLGKTINTVVDIGIRAIFPEFLEEQIINIKDNLVNYGLKDGISKTIDDAIDLGKSAMGIFTGNFENISQMQKAIETGGLIDGISSLLDTVVDKIQSTGIVNGRIANTIKQGKDVILNNIESNIEKNFSDQINGLENMDTYISNWKKDFENKDFEKMEIEYKKIEEALKNLVPLENVINQARTIENLHNLIKNNGQNFELSKEQLELAEKLK